MKCEKLGRVHVFLSDELGRFAHRVLTSGNGKERVSDATYYSVLSQDLEHS